MSWYLWYLRELAWQVLTTICSSTDTCFDSLFSEIDVREVLRFVWMQHLTYPNLFWWNFSSASIACDIFIFSPFQFFPLHIRWSDVLVPFMLSLWSRKAYVMGLAGHFILTFSVDIPITSIVSPGICSTSCSVESPLNPLLRLYHSSGLLELCCTPYFLFYLSLLSWKTFDMLVILSSIRLYLSSPSSCIFPMVVFMPCICRPNDFVIVLTYFFHLLDRCFRFAFHLFFCYFWKVFHLSLSIPRPRWAATTTSYHSVISASSFLNVLFCFRCVHWLFSLTL